MRAAVPPPDAPPPPPRGPTPPPPAFLLAFPPPRRAIIESVAAAYVGAGGSANQFTPVLAARFCAQAAWDEAAARAAARATAAWRAASGAEAHRDAFVRGEVPLAHEAYRLYMRLLDVRPALPATRDGDLLALYFVGGFDVRAFCRAVSAAQYDEANLICIEWQYLELDRASLRRADGTLARVFAVVDLRHHVGLDVLRYFKRSAPLVELYYPYFMSRTLLLHAPRVFVATWAFLRPLFSRELQEKVVFHASGSPLQLDRSVPADCIPVRYGGELSRLPDDVAQRLGVDLLEEPHRERILQLGPSTPLVGGCRAEQVGQVERAVLQCKVAA